jgi:heme/copper-type cytochrome/quinol oxidase subunit 3
LLQHPRKEEIEAVRKMAVADLHHAEHGLDFATRRTRARVGVLLLILTDGMFVAAIMAGHLYLRALNVAGAFRPHDEAPPSAIVGFIVTLLIVASAGAFYQGEQRLRKGGPAGFGRSLMLAWVLSVVALVGQIILLVGLRYPTPLHAYGSMILLLSGYHVVHLALTVLIGFLLLGRVRNKRIAGYEYVVEGSAYWWYYVAAAAVVVWIFMAAAS